MRPEGSSRPPLAEQLDLTPHPEGGWFRETWRSPTTWHPSGYDGERATATCIYFLLAAGEQSRWHRVRSTELWLWHAGGPLHLLLGGNGGAPADSPETVTLGAEIAAGHAPQVIVPPDNWQAARPAGSHDALVSCVVSPGFDFADFEFAQA